jgi:predicted ATPase
VTQPADPGRDDIDRRPIRAFRPWPDAEVDFSRWPGSVPAVGQVLRDGLELAAGLTVLVGENGSGKSSVVEMLAEAYGLNPQGGSVQGRLFRTRDSEPGIGSCLQVERGLYRPAWAYFLRADTMHSLYTYLEENPGRRPERYHELSHGEGFLAVLRSRVNQHGFYLMDEPDTPLSFVACLGLAALLHDLAASGSQAIVATHSPIIAAVPGATILELGDWGLRPARWAELDLVVSWRRFLTEPGPYFRRVLGD